MKESQYIEWKESWRDDTRRCGGDEKFGRKFGRSGGQDLV